MDEKRIQFFKETYGSPPLAGSLVANEVGSRILALSLYYNFINYCFIYKRTQGRLSV
jgi:hypothetical protein